MKRVAWFLVLQALVAIGVAACNEQDADDAKSTLEGHDDEDSGTQPQKFTDEDTPTEQATQEDPPTAEGSNSGSPATQTGKADTESESNATCPAPYKCLPATSGVITPSPMACQGKFGWSHAPMPA